MNYILKRNGNVEKEKCCICPRFYGGGITQGLRVLFQLLLGEVLLYKIAGVDVHSKRKALYLEIMSGKSSSRLTLIARRLLSCP